MSKSFNVNMDSFSNEMDNIYAGITPVQTDTTAPVEKIQNDTPKQKVATKPKKSDKIDHKKTNGTNKKDNYAITFKIDADIDDYLKNIEWVKYIECKEKNTNKNKYVNELIRQDMIKTLKLKSNATYDEIQTAWENYKKANNI